MDPRWRYTAEMATHAPPEVRRAQILEAALHCFGEKGLHAARMDEIARRSGLSKGAIYFHFASKEEIFLALFEAYERAIFAEWEKIEDPEDPLHAIEQLGEIALRQILSSRPLLEAWPEFIRHPKARGRMAKIYER